MTSWSSYNARRQFAVAYRRTEVAHLLLSGVETQRSGLFEQQTETARQLGVSPSTISRDLDAIQRC